MLGAQRQRRKKRAGVVAGNQKSMTGSPYPCVLLFAFGFRLRHLRAGVRALCTLALAASLGCSDGGADEGVPGAGAKAGQDPQVDLNLGGSTNIGSNGIVANGCELTTDGSECTGQAYEGEAIPLDIYIMFDQSGSMLNDVGGVTRLDAIERAARTFLRDQASANIRVGLGYFGFQEIGKTSCDTETYTSADVEVTLDHELVIDSLASREPTGETPTGAAIRGACTYAQGWKQENPGHAVVLLLLTDGEPKAPQSCAAGACCPTLADAVAAAVECRDGDPGIKSYVLGVGPFLENLQQIAEAGGTEHAYLVGDQDVEQNVLEALKSIRGDASIPCQLRIPEPPTGATLDFNQVNVAYQADDCTLSTIYYVSEPAQCDAVDGGWYYDDAAAPTSVQLCDSTCEQVAAPGGRLAFTVGCETRVPVK
jgi:hypothetical protein